MRNPLKKHKTSQRQRRLGKYKVAGVHIFRMAPSQQVKSRPQCPNTHNWVWQKDTSLHILRLPVTKSMKSEQHTRTPAIQETTINSCQNMLTNATLYYHQWIPSDRKTSFWKAPKRTRKPEALAKPQWFRPRIEEAPVQEQVQSRSISEAQVRLCI